MGALDQIVDIEITQQTAAVAQPSFSIPLIVGPNASSTLAYYTAAKDLLTAGFTTSSIEYIYAVELMEQALAPTTFGVGKRTSVVAQVDTLTPDVSSQQVQHYIATIAGVAYDFTSDSSPTAGEVVTGLNALINGDANCPAAATGSVTSILTGKVAGNGFTTTVSTNLTLVHTTPNNGIADDLTAIVNDPLGGLWYGMALCSNTAADILEAASFIEATGNRIFIGASNDSNIPTSLTTDLASVLKGKSYKRTGLMYSPQGYNKGMDAAWLGGQLPQVPGASTWALKTLVGITPDNFNATQMAAMIGLPGVNTGKNVNAYTTIGGQNIVQPGTMAGGKFIDVTVFIDWLKFTMQSAIFGELVNNPKIPYTDKGLAVIENQVLNVLIQGSDDGGTGGIDHTSIVVSVVSVSSIPVNDRALRYVPAGSVKFSARLTGAFQNIVVNGIVSV